MPELPEVETVRLQLRQQLVKKRIKAVTVLNLKTVNHNKNFSHQLAGKVINDIDRIGKLMIVSFAKEPDLFLLIHLKMTGQLFFKSRAGVLGGGHTLTESTKQLPNKHTRVAFTFSDNATLFFNDMRLFGYAKLVTAEELVVIRARFGQEPISPDFDGADFMLKLKKRTATIKAVLLDQSFIAGLGNIYVDETLFHATVRPTRRAHLVTKTEALAIIKFSQEVLKQSIRYGGTTFQHFLDTGGQNGNYTDCLQVFGRQKLPCLKCGTLIKKIRVAGRGTHYCPKCQR